MKHSKIIITVAVLVLSLLGGCTKNAPAPQPAPQPAESQPTATLSETTPPPAAPATPARSSLKVATLKGPTGMGMVRLMQQNDLGETGIDYTITLASTPDEIVGWLVTGEVDIAAAPINLASTLYNRTQGGVDMIAINTMGVLYVLENGESIRSMQDLSGKTIYATGQGATPEYILNYLLEQNGLTGKVTVQFMNDHAELATLLAAGKVDIALLPEPNVTMALLKNENLRIALDMTKEWDALKTGTTLVQGSIVARREVLTQNPEAVLLFLQEYADSTTFSNEQTESAAQLIEQYEIMGAAAAAQRALPQSNIVCITGAEMKKSAQAMLEILFAANPQSIGGALPGDDFYYMP